LKGKDVLRTIARVIWSRRHADEVNHHSRNVPGTHLSFFDRSVGKWDMGNKMSGKCRLRISNGLLASLSPVAILRAKSQFSSGAIETGKERAKRRLQLFRSFNACFVELLFVKVSFWSNSMRCLSEYCAFCERQRSSRQKAKQIYRTSGMFFRGGGRIAV
jgi:hypothetical protein